MSLINQMLIDLDARAEEVEELELRQRPVVQDLRPANAPTPRGGRTILALVSLLLTAVCLAYIWSTVGRDDRWPLHATDSPDAVSHDSVTATQPVSTRDSASPLPPATIDATPVVNRALQMGTPATSETAVATELNVDTPVSTTPSAAVSGIRSARMSPTESTDATPVATGAFSRVARELTPAQEADRAFQSAIRLRRSGNIAEAEHELRDALRHDPRHSRAREVLAELYVDQGHWQDAQQVLHEGIAIDPDNYQFTLWLARLHVERGDESKAIALLEGGLANAGSDPDYHATLATLYQRAGRHADAATEYRNALAQEPRNGRWWLGLGIAYETQQRWPGARDAYLRAIGSAMLDERLSAFAEKRLDEVTRQITPAGKSGTP